MTKLPHPLLSDSTTETHENDNRRYFIQSPRRLIKPSSTMLEPQNFEISLSHRPTKNRKVHRVRFLRHKSTNLCACEYYENAWPLPETPKERNALWYSSFEFRVFKKDCCRKTRSEEAEQFRQDFQRVYEACGTAEGLKRLRTADSTMLCSTEFRGLEVVLFHKRGNRQQKVGTIVQAHAKQQSAFWSSDDCGDNDNNRDLATMCRELTLHDRRMARVLGNGDAYEAQEKVIASKASLM